MSKIALVRSASVELCNLKADPLIRDELRKIALRSGIPLHELTNQILRKFLKTNEMLHMHRRGKDADKR